MNNKGSILNLQYIGIAILGFASLLFNPSIAFAESCASKYPAKHHLEPAIHDIFQNACYSCPKGAQRTGEGIFSQRSCVIPAGTKYSHAKDHGRSGILGANCRGKIYDVGLGKCFTCPSGFSRSVYPATSKQACIKNERAKFGKAVYRGPVPSDNPEIERRAKQELSRFAESLVNSLQQLITLSEDPNFVQKIASGNRRYNAEIDWKVKEIINNNTSLRSFRTISLGGTADANLLIINGAVDTGVSIAINGVRPVYWYGGASYGVKIGAGASAGLSLGLWNDESNQIYGDFHGFFS